ncbi:MAG: cytochrome c oxidase subunit I [Myxococcota bacterium]
MSDQLALYQNLQPMHHEPTKFVWKYLFTVDHKVIAKQFLWTGLAFLFLGGLLAMGIRWQWAFPNEPIPGGTLFMPETGGVIGPANYASTFTMHGLIMIFWAITPGLIGCFGNFCIPLMIGARDMAFPKLNMYSFWTFALSGVLVVACFFVPFGAAGAGWTTYPPLSTNVGTPGWGQSLVVTAIFVTGVATIMGSVNYVTTVIRLRAPGMGYFKMPLTVWGLWLTAILNVLFVPVLGAAGLLLVFDRTFGTDFFIAGAQGSGDPILFQHLFWIFGHPEVYILILPAWGIMGDLLSFFSRKPAFWYRGSCFAMIAVTVLSAVVYGHHMFDTGMSPLLGHGFMLLTLIISVPAEMLFLNWLHTIWKGSMRKDTPMLFGLGAVFVFGLGGLTGIFLGTISTDIYLHDTMFVVGHFHFTMAAASLLGMFAGIYFWYPKMFGRMMDETLGKIHYWGTVITITVTFTGQMMVGYAGQQRRLWDPYQYAYVKNLQDLNIGTSMAAFAMFAFQFAFIWNFCVSMWRGKKASNNPWNVGTLEWTTTSPPPNYNFKVVPHVHWGPHEFSNPALMEALGRDFVMQDEVVPGFGDEGDKMPLPEAAPEVDESPAESVEADAAPMAESAVAPEAEVAEAEAAPAAAESGPAEVVDLPTAEEAEEVAEADSAGKAESGS